MDQDVLASAERRIQELEVENRLARAVGSVNQGLKDALDQNGQKYDAMRSQLEAAEQRIQELKTQIHETKADLIEQGKDFALEVESLLDHIDSSRDEIHRWMDYAVSLQTPCRCDPPGSGEEWCNGTCQIKDTLARLMDESGRVSHGNTNVIEMFDAAVAQVRGEKTSNG